MERWSRGWVRPWSFTSPTLPYDLSHAVITLLYGVEEPGSRTHISSQLDHLSQGWNCYLYQLFTSRSPSAGPRPISCPPPPSAVLFRPLDFFKLPRKNHDNKESFTAQSKRIYSQCYNFKPDPGYVTTFISSSIIISYPLQPRRTPLPRSNESIIKKHNSLTSA
ncbi:hypothetical protein LZ30DRAFT_132712 [Colletotrichum cereale]|nr:hypothetical protein LZ30DRAFT_132712 [Colletotrichum cereale]